MEKEILFVGDIYNYRNRMSTNFINFVDKLSKKFNIVYYGDQENQIKVKHSLMNVINEYCETVDPIVWICDVRGASMIVNKNEYDGIKIFDVEDIAGKLQFFVNEFDVSGYKYVLYKNDCPNFYDLQELFSNLVFIRYDHFIDHNIFRDYKLEKKYDILCYGCIEWGFYPFRKRLFELFKNNKDFNTCYLEHPSYGYTRKHDIIDDKLSKLINESRITIVTPSTLEFLLKKYTEAALSKSCMLGRLPKYNGEKYQNCLIEIDEKMSDEEIIDKVKYYLENEKEREEITERAYNVAKNNYTYESGLEYFTKIFGGMVENTIKTEKDVYNFELKKYQRNQNAELLIKNDRLYVKSLQNTSTPGIKRIFSAKNNSRYKIKIKGFVENDDMIVGLWIGDMNGNTRIFRECVLKREEIMEIEYYNENNGNIYVGLLIRNPKINDSFELEYIRLEEQ